MPNFCKLLNFWSDKIFEYSLVLNVLLTCRSQIPISRKETKTDIKISAKNPDFTNKERYFGKYEEDYKRVQFKEDVLGEKEF